jgi:hypothetical protein
MMLVDCNTCPVRHVQCEDCMVTALTALPLALGEAPRPVLAEAPRDDGAGPPLLALDRAERHAVSILLGAGLVTVQEANAARSIPDDAPTSAGAGKQDGGRTSASTRPTGSGRSAGSTRVTRAAG